MLFLHVIMFFHELNLLLKLNQLSSRLLHWFEITLASVDRLIKESHLKFAKRFVEVKTTIAADKVLLHLNSANIVELGVSCVLNCLLLLLEKSCELLKCHFEFSHLEKACSKVETRLVVKSLVVRLNQLLKAICCLVKLSLRV